MTLRKYLVIVAIIVFASFGDISLSYGMKRVGTVSWARWTELIAAVFTPWVALGIVLLLGFMAAYLSALSWSDLTYVLPATSFGYVLLALLSVWLLHEKVSLSRWIGILLVSSGVAIVTRGPSATNRQQAELAPTAAGEKP
jgi:drug/metabolite transporter (DMT)-like permease